MARRRHTIQCKSADGRYLQAGDCVYYGLDSFGRERQSWRVTSFMRKVYERVLPRPGDDADITEQIVWDIHNNGRRKSHAERLINKLPANRRFRYIWCFPWEATHVNLVAVCGATAPIEECEFIEVVPWSPEMVAQEQLRALTHIGHDRFCEWEWE